MSARDLPSTICDRDVSPSLDLVQPHGVLLVADRSNGRVTHAAGRIAEVLGVEDWLGRPLSELLGPQLETVLSSSDLVTLRNLSPPQALRDFDVLLIPQSEELLVEIEPAAAADLRATILPRLERSAYGLERAGDMRDLLETAAREFRSLTGYDRVMVCQFLEDGSAEVVAAEGTADDPSFRNHHFPASDLPLEARALYLRSLVRVIADVASQSQPLWPSRAAETPLDLSTCSLRSATAAHLRELQSRGVSASATFSIVRDGALWGLITCHNDTPRPLPVDVRNGGRVLCSALSRQIRTREEAALYQEKLRLRGYEDRLSAAFQDDAPLEEVLARHLPDLVDMLGADGAAVIREGEILRHGRCPSEAEILGFVPWVMARSGAPVFTTDCLAETAAEHLCSHPGGLLTMKLPGEDDWTLLCFRDDPAKVIKGAGASHGTPELGAIETLTQRASFQGRSERRRRAQPWSRAEKETCLRLLGTLQTIWQSRHISRLNMELRLMVAEKEALLKQREFLLGEVNHRIQNNLTLVSGFLSMQARNSADDATKAALGEARHRVSAVALVNRRLYGTEQAALVDVSRYVDELLDDLASSVDPRWREQIQRDLTKAMLPVDRAVKLGLIIAELFINMSKYAYEGTVGPVEVTLSRTDDHLRLKFADKGRGRAASGQTSGSGFGSQMMRVLIQALEGGLEFSDNDPGLCATITFKSLDGA